MHVVTRIEPQKKRSGYYNIYINGEYRFSLGELDLATYGLAVNQTVEPQELENLLQASLNSKAYNYSLRYLALRPRSSKEISDYLIRKGFGEEQVQAAIESLTEQNYLNDTDFAQMWVRNRLKLNARSKSVLRLELIKKGIEKDAIEHVLAEVTPEEFLDSLKELINKKRHLSKYQDDEKLVQYLVRKGYNYGLVKQALQD
jgi:regulatory protein